MSLFNKIELDQKHDQYLRKRSFTKSASTIIFEDSTAFNETKYYDIFLSHCFLDDKYIFTISEIIKEMGYTVYVDWIEDSQLDRKNVNKRTAEILKIRMKNCKCLFYAVSENATNSKWMPWELGYFDGIKSKVAILPVNNSIKQLNNFEGQEYLGLYAYVSKDRSNGAEKENLLIHTNDKEYVDFKNWLLHGKIPIRH